MYSTFIESFSFLGIKMYFIDSKIQLLLMRKIVLFFLALIVFPIWGVSDVYAEIPDWIKNNAGWWAEDLIEDEDFLNGIEFLLNEEIIKIESVSVSEQKSEFIPNWIKNNAAWWAEGQIDDETFVQGLQFLIQKGILRV